MEYIIILYIIYITTETILRERKRVSLIYNCYEKVSQETLQKVELADGRQRKTND